MCIGMPNKGYQLEMISLPIRLSINYQVKQINHEVAKKHYRGSTYNNPNVHIKIIIPCIYLVKHLCFSTTEETPTNPDGIYNDNGYNNTYRHLLHQFIYSILGITRVSKMLNHPMNNITNSKIVFRLNGLQMLGCLRGGTK